MEGVAITVRHLPEGGWVHYFAKRWVRNFANSQQYDCVEARGAEPQRSARYRNRISQKGPAVGPTEESSPRPTHGTGDEPHDEGGPEAAGRCGSDGPDSEERT
jgi:hypothetical protein